MTTRRRKITPAERLPMYHAEEVGGDSTAAVIEKPEGDFVIQTRDEEIPFNPEPKTDIHVHVDLGLPELVESIADLVRNQERVARRIRRSVSSPIQADEQQRRIFTQPPRPREVFKPQEPKVEPEIPMGGLLQTENPALYVLRTGNNPVGKHDTPKSKHREHGQKGSAKLDPSKAREHGVIQTVSFEREGSYLVDPDGEVLFTSSAIGHIEMLEPLGLDPDTDMDAMVRDKGYVRIIRENDKELAMESGDRGQQKETAQQIISSGEDPNQTVYWDLLGVNPAKPWLTNSGRSTLGELAGYGKGSKVGQFRSRTDLRMEKAPGIDESGPEPVTGYRLGSPPTAPPVPRGFKLANDVIQDWYRVEKDISGPGSPTDSSDVYTPAAGGSRKQKRPKAQDMLGVVGEELD